MGEGPQLPGEWDGSATGEPPAQLLRRAISHVESLLHRLEPAVENAETDAGTAPEAAAEPPAAPVAVSLDRTDRADRADTTATTATTATAATPAPGDRPAAGFTPLSSVSGAEKAEALRITLHAHEEAHRIQAEANALRAAAAADGERMLLEARSISDQVHVEARESATALLAAARNEAQALLETARAEASTIRQRAVADHDSRLAEYDALAEQERAAALDEANVIIEQAQREAEHIRAEAREAGRAEAARTAQEQVSSAVADVRHTMHTLLEQVRQSLAAFDDSVSGIDPAPVAQAEPDAVADDESEPEREPVPERPASERAPERRPLGLLFGAQRG